MPSLGEELQHADWKSEKHVPVIEAPDQVTAGQPFTVQVSVGKEIPHPNTTEHHIMWITLYFKPVGDKFTYEVGRYEFLSHGASAKGANQGPVYTDPIVTTTFKVMGPGTLYAVEACNIHGLWESTKELQVM